MSIFRRDRESTGSAPSSPSPASEAPAASSQRRRITHIAPGTRIRGEVTGSSELLVEGEVEGDIRVDSVVVVGAEGSIQGPINAQVVRIGGRVTGNVSAAERVEVSPAGSVEGDIAASRVVIAEGAFFKGRIEMSGEKNAAGRSGKGPGEPSKAAGEPQKAPATPGKA
ncbi:MAG TPA: polymer-forming cytoskeletal protein [Thermoanaerobaculia bacterium]|nr:polymer-forming cytoskeletal protein [Thermoanaerobaculia bacterium]